MISTRNYDSRFFEYKAENGQRVGVYETKPKSLEAELTDHVRRTIIMPASHDYRIEPLWMAQADIIATSALYGNFMRHSRVKIDAIESTVGLDKDESITILGFSLGAASCYLLENLWKRGYSVDDVMLYEDVSPGRGFDIRIPARMMSILPGVENDHRKVSRRWHHL